MLKITTEFNEHKKKNVPVYLSCNDKCKHFFKNLN